MAVDMSQHFSMGRLVRYSMPSILMMLFTSLYGIVDGFFVSNYAGKVALAAVNWAWPLLMIFSAIGFMIGTGGSALVAKTRGEGDEERANRYFSMLVFFALGLGIVLAVVAALIMRPVFELMGASGEMLDLALVYGYISCVSLPGFVILNTLQALFVTAGKPKNGLYVMLLTGILNMVLDWLLIAVLGWDVAGAAIATAFSEVVGGAVSFAYFVRRNTSFLQLRWTRLEWRPIGQACLNGSSEMVSEISMSLVSMLYNYQLLRLIGEDGVAAYGAVMYVALLFVAIFIGFSIGTDPLMSFQYGAENKVEMNSLYRKSMLFMIVGGVLMLMLAELFAPGLAMVFTSYDEKLSELTTHAFRIFSISALFAGVAIYGSALFTALNNGIVSAIISLLRTLVFEAGAVLLLPLAFGAEGIWFATPVAELAACIVSGIFIAALGRRYGFLRGETGSKRA